MVASRALRPLTLEEYVEIERRATFRSEFIDGALYAMAGGSQRHARIAANVAAALHTRLAGLPCQEFSSDFQLFIEEAQLATYPDVSVYCGPVLHWRDRLDAGTNPSVLFEVLSLSKAADDRGEVFTAYQRVRTLQEYVLLSQEHPLAEVFTRAATPPWSVTTVRGLEASIRLQALGVDLPLHAVFDRVEFPPE